MYDYTGFPKEPRSIVTTCRGSGPESSDRMLNVRLIPSYLPQSPHPMAHVV